MVLLVIAFIRMVVVCRGRSTAAAEKSICVLYNIILYPESGIPHAVTRRMYIIYLCAYNCNMTESLNHNNIAFPSFCAAFGSRRKKIMIY